MVAGGRGNRGLHAELAFATAAFSGDVVGSGEREGAEGEEWRGWMWGAVDAMAIGVG